MKVILLQDVKKVGKKGEVVKVADGYGQNFLIKNKLAVLETNTSRKIVESQKEAEHQQDLENQAKAKELAKEIESITLEFTLKSGKDGKTFGSALLKFGLTFENKKWIRTIFRGILLTIYFCIIPAGLFYLADEFNKEADSLLFLCLLAIAFLAFILFVLITIVVALFNRRFMFDRLSDASYESTIQVKQEK